MKTIFKLVLTLGSILLCLNAFSGVPNNDHPRTFLGPTIKGSFTDSLSNRSAYSVAGEAGFKNFRAGGTMGWMVSDNQRIKGTIEFLLQKITYPFFSGNTDEWVTQGAIGADYQYDIVGFYGCHSQFDLSAFLSHAPSKGLGTTAGTFVNKLGVTQNYVDLRRIAGSNAAGISPGITFQPWMGTKAGAQLNYDSVRYDTNYVKNHDAIGFGGTVFVTQALANNINLNLLAAVRQPFNNYQASIDWVNVPQLGPVVVGIEGAYTAGKNTLPSTYNASVTVDYYLDRNTCTTGPNRQIAQDFLAWTGSPAIYLPQVLAIPDERVTITTPGCPIAAPTFTGIIADIIPPPNTSTQDIKPFFTGDNLTYTLNVITPPTLPNAVSMGANGIINITNLSTFLETASFSVTATNQCGTVTSNVFSIGFGIPSIHR